MPIDERILFRVAFLYLKKFHNQNEISNLLNIAPRTVKSYLYELKNRPNYVGIKIKSDGDKKYYTELLLQNKYKLTDVILVMDHDDPDEISRIIGDAASKFVSKKIRIINKKKNKVTISLGHGSIIKTMIENMGNYPNIPATICGLVNDPFQKLMEDRSEYATTRVYALVSQLRSKIRLKASGDDIGIYVFPTDIPMNRKERKRLVRTAQTKKTLKKIRDSDILVFGVGGFIPDTIYYEVIKRYECEDKKPYISELKKSCVGGLGGSMPIDKAGKLIETYFTTHFIGINLNDVEKISDTPGKYSIVVGHGKDRALAIKATIQNHKYANVLITNIETGKRLLEI